MIRKEAIQMLRLYEVNETGEGELKTWYNGIDKDMREAIDMAIEALKEQPTIPMFKESEEAYKAWTGEEIGKDIKAKQKEVGAVADGIAGYETIQKQVEKAKIVYGGTLDVVSGLLTVDNIMDMEQAVEWCKDCQHNEVCRYYPYDGCQFKDTSERSRGEWIQDPSYIGVSDVPICSNCRKRPPRIECGGKLIGGYGAEATGSVWQSEFKYHRSDFCPNCGADMRGEGE